jgi:hypothetical protein
MSTIDGGDAEVISTNPSPAMSSVRHRIDKKRPRDQTMAGAHQ